SAGAVGSAGAAGPARLDAGPLVVPGAPGAAVDGVAGEAGGQHEEAGLADQGPYPGQGGVGGGGRGGARLGGGPPAVVDPRGHGTAARCAVRDVDPRGVLAGPRVRPPGERLGGAVAGAVAATGQRRAQGEGGDEVPVGAHPRGGRHLVVDDGEGDGYGTGDRGGQQRGEGQQDDAASPVVRTAQGAAVGPQGPSQVAPGARPAAHPPGGSAAYAGPMAPVGR